jgi:hypothetical protein
MKNVARVIASMIFVTLISGCGMSTEDINETVKSSMQETLSTDSNFKEYNLKVDSVKALKKGDNTYKGLVSIIYKGSSHDITVEIIVDGGNVMWEAAPGSFMFIAREEFQNIFQ